MEFKDLIGTKQKFYGVDACAFKLGDYVFEAIEDESDGYRSYLGSIEITNKVCIFYQRPIAIVEVMEVERFNEQGWGLFTGFVLCEEGYEWLVVGTDNNDDYYPCFMFNYYPKEVLIPSLRSQYKYIEEEQLLFPWGKEREK